ncbi:MAG TPA: hypothetical protein VLA66_00985, partial [Thermoanaerobaculia bacterium]|nr:hypothetical protein [Thermoanaerobaculia bacterium]
QFSGFTPWGAAYDATNDRVLFNSGTTLYEWPIGGSVNLLGTITNGGGGNLSMVALAWYQNTLYATRNIANEAVYSIDLSTLVATPVIDYDDATYDFGGLSIDPATGEFYGTDDGSNDALMRINMDGSATLIAPYPVGQTDIDGLAVGGGFAYLVTDEPGDIFVWDFGGGSYATPIPNPWTTAETFSAGAWIEVVDTMPFIDGFESGDTSAWSSTVP